ncbi:sodium:proton antiporter [Clostridium sp. CS001]|uniref:cation:proton antiporter n=1 Tax=Clostridium sp. CS001 TaxID=2880648 RepID=UPI001CF4A4B7|nr:sodium:proton antiporter [Clostridium sp. CS001]MCB2288670.1 sodium:proton antiporter [Clostridium sp. CS001]
MEAQNLLELFALVIVSGVLFTKLSKMIKLPDVVMFIIAGILLGPSVLNLVNIDRYPVGNDLILTFGAAYILYDGGREIELKILNKVKVSLVLISTVGVLISTVVIGFFASIIFKMDFMYALLLGSVIASTDPSVLVPLFKKMKISDKLKQFIISESAFNDAAGAIITFAILGVIQGSKFSIQTSLFELGKTSFGGIAVGLVIGTLATMLITHDKYGYFKENPSEIRIATVAGTYVVATRLGVSGFMAVFIIGIICGNKHLFSLRVQEEHYITQTRFKEVLTLLLRMMIFILLGTHIDFASVSQYWKQALLIVGLLIFVARPLSVLLCVTLDRKAKWNLKEIIYIMWIRETGVIPAALAGMLVSMQVQHANIISSVTFVTILVTLSVQASTAQWLAKKLKLEV